MSSSKVTDIIHLVNSDNTLSANELAKEMYGSIDAANALLIYNDLHTAIDKPLPAGSQLRLPYKLSSISSSPKNGILEIKLFSIQPRILDLQWKTNEIVASDGSNSAEMFAEIACKTAFIADETSATFEVYQHSQDSKHILIDSNPTLKIVNNQLCGPDGKPFRFWFEWHKTIYDWGKHYYFAKIIIGNIEYEMQKTNDVMLRLIHYNYLVNDPADKFGFWAANECKTVKSYLSGNGRFFDFFSGKEQPTKQYVKLSDGGNKKFVTKDSYKEFLNKGIVYHHYLSSHGDAICNCDGNDNPVDEFPNNVTNDGVIDWLCPVCRNKSLASGAFCFANEEYFTKVDALTLVYVPKLLLVASCCLTAITDIFPKTWLDKGTRWYIGWAVPVEFTAAHKFAKKFYTTWCNKYNINPDKVKDAFDAVQGGFWKWRPRLFGK